MWYVLGELVSDQLTDEQILSLFEHFSKGIGEKYFEKGYLRQHWLSGQLKKIKDEHESQKVEPFKASNQLWVEYLHEDILNTFIKEYELEVNQKQSG